jgi:hypothetical protein
VSRSIFVARVELLGVKTGDDPYERLHPAMYRWGGFRRWIELNATQWAWLPTGTYVADESRLGDIRDALDTVKYAADSTEHDSRVVVWRTQSGEIFAKGMRALTDVEKSKEVQREAAIDAEPRRST